MRDTPREREIVVPRDMHADRGSARPSRSTGGARKRRPTRGEFRAASSAVLSWLGRTCIERPGGVVGTLVGAGAAVYVSLNAVGFQSGRHPAPILPQPTIETAGIDTHKTAKPASEAKAAPDIAHEQAPAPREPARTAAARDGIGELIRDVDETTASVTPKPDKTVMRAQRALSKLGYGPLKDDGLMGAGTKAAIMKFERERKLPVTGEAAGRTLRELATRAQKG